VKVLHVAEQAKGGVSTILNELLNYSSNIDSVTTAVLTNKNHEQYINKDSKIYTFKGTRSVIGLFSFFLRVREVVNDFKPDIVHLHSSFAGAVGRLALMFSNIKIVYHPHGVSFDPDRVQGFKGWTLKFIEQVLSIFCHKIIAISKYELLCLETIIARKKLALVVNGVRDVDVDFNLARNEKLLFIGRLDTQKGLQFLLDFYINNTPNYELDIAGESCVTNSSDKINNSKVKYLGWLDYEEVPTLLSSYKAVIIPSLWEGFGLVAIEALRSGTPIITSDRGALPYIVSQGDSIGTVFKLDDIDNSLPDSLHRLDQIYDADIHSRCRQTFLDNFESSKMCADIFRVYSSLSNKSQQNN